MSGSNAPASGIGDRIVGKVKEVTGSLIGDEVLEHEGELHQERADAARDAAERAIGRRERPCRCRAREPGAEFVAEEQALRSEEAVDAREVALEREQQTAEARITREDTARRKAAEVDEFSALRKVELDEAEARRNLDAERREAAALEADATPRPGHGRRARRGRRPSGRKHVSFTRTLVNGGLGAARLPLTVAEATVGRGTDTEEWPPSIAFDQFGATVKELVGSLTHNATLLDEGRLTRAKVAQLRHGIELETEAALRRDAAEREHAARLDADDERRQAVSDQAAARTDAADERRAQEEREVEERLERERVAAAEADERTKAAAAKRERAARAKRLNAERVALAEAKRTRAAEDHVDDVTEALEATKSRRKSST